MLDEGLKRLVERELGEVYALLEKSAGLLVVPDGEEPSFERLAALSQILNSFYTGLERIFDRIARHVDDERPVGERWHAELLSRMSKSGPRRPALISDECHAHLREYLAFRHRSHHAYAHHVEWRPMRHLVQDLASVWRMAQNDVRVFLASDASRESS